MPWYVFQHRQRNEFRLVGSGALAAELPDLIAADARSNPQARYETIEALNENEAWRRIENRHFDQDPAAHRAEGRTRDEA